ncbi:MAG: hypothetical protein IJ043_08185 [Clostridia bacterium]|nr:hypothetical protein [Clostridia bacterium]
MNIQNEQGKEPQYIISLENALASIEQVAKLLRCFVDFAENEGNDADDGLTFKERSIRALNFVTRLDDHLSMIYVGVEALENNFFTIDKAISAIQSERWNPKAVAK